MNRTIPGLVARAIEEFGDREAVVAEDQRWTFAELGARAGAAARAFVAAGIEPGDRVAILAANCPEWILAWWAVVSLGGIVVALNGWWTRDEIEYGLGLSEPTLLIGDERRLARLESALVALLDDEPLAVDDQHLRREDLVLHHPADQ